MKYVIAFAMVLALGVAALGMYLDVKPQQNKFSSPWTIKQIHCAVYSDC
jgi:hypothetical protein